MRHSSARSRGRMTAQRSSHITARRSLLAWRAACVVWRFRRQRSQANNKQQRRDTRVQSIRVVCFPMLVVLDHRYPRQEMLLATGFCSPSFAVVVALRSLLLPSPVLSSPPLRLVARLAALSRPRASSTRERTRRTSRAQRRGAHNTDRVEGARSRQ